MKLKEQSGKPENLRQHNRYVILRYLTAEASLSQSALAKLSGLALPSVMRIVAELEAEGVVYSTGKGESTGGRKPQMVSINPQYRYLVGIELAMSVKIILTDFLGQVLYVWESDSLLTQSPEAVLFTLRNGSLKDPKLGTPYAEKLIMLKAGQRLPLHYHASKTEDIINRGGGVLAINLYNSLADGSVDYANPVIALLDGIEKEVMPGKILFIMPGESITLRPFQYHRFWAEGEQGDLLLGEVSSINDDHTDNFNAEPASRFTQIEEDEAVKHPLCNEYEKLLGDLR